MHKYVITILVLTAQLFTGTLKSQTTPYPRGEKTAYNTAFLEAGATIRLANGTEFVVDSELGKGHHGIVYRGHNRSTNESVAIKINFKEAYVYTPSFKSQFVIPINAQAAIVTTVTGEILPEKIVEVMPIGLPLPKILEREQRVIYRLEIAYQLLNDVINGLIDINRFDYAHNDIKPANIIKLNNRFVISDLGSTKKQGRRTYARGTNERMAPEQFTQFKNTFYSDTYQLAKTLLEVVFVQRPTFYRSQMVEVAEGAKLLIATAVDLNDLSNYLNKYARQFRGEDYKRLQELRAFLEAALKPDLEERMSALDEYMQRRNKVLVRQSVVSCMDLFF